MADKGITTIGRCYGCKRTFGFDPERVTMFLVDPDPAAPPSMTAPGTQPTPEALARSRREPVCPDCVRRGQHTRQDDGPTWPRGTA
ncbi:hypothetical protein AB0H88_15575 [Nonomuraea sp. NPDC050680]|jgi:hypothetical protein|uniref:hypothetical protein n=1 Tax=Nonomuraea sp. NPDC050680 TaxID=3154630 RepID=UPI0033EC295A